MRLSIMTMTNKRHFSEQCTANTLFIFFLFVDSSCYVGEPLGPIMCQHYCKNLIGCTVYQYRNNQLQCFIDRNLRPSRKDVYNVAPQILSPISQCKPYTRRFLSKTNKMKCVEEKVPRSCKDVLKINLNAKSGDYTLHPPAYQFRNNTVTIFCLMDEKAPKEYITLKSPNYGIFPNTRQSMIGCSSMIEYSDPDEAARKRGRCSFSKIRVNIRDMTLIPEDRTYCVSKRDHCFYGRVEDCRSKNCKPRGFFLINTTDSGVRFSRKLKWINLGYKPAKPKVKRISENEIKIYCGGECGVCNPEGKMYLYPSHRN